MFAGINLHAGKGMIKMDKLIKKHPVIAVLRGIPDDDLIDYMNSLYAGGLRAFEISFSSSGAPAQVERARDHMPADACIGAGTVLTVSDARMAGDVGADFLLSPSTNPEVLSYCGTHDVRLLPGVFSPTDVSVCLEYGFHTLKLFPASSHQPGFIKALQGPFPQTEYVAVGGVSPANTADYLRSGFAGVGIGGSLVDAETFRQRKWDEITRSIQKFLNDLRKENLL